MKRILLSLVIAVAGVGFVAADADARRLGGGATSGLKRQLPPPRAPDAPKPAQPNQQAAPTTANAVPAAAQAPAKRSWLGPIAGIAAGLGLAALMSHLGLGAEFANILMLMLVAVVGFIAVRWAMNRFGKGAQAAAAQASMPRNMQLATAGGPSPASPVQPAGFGSASLRTEPQLAQPQFAAAAGAPAGFDSAGFERAAKMIFIRMQAANDAGDLEDLRRFSTPEMYAAFKLDMQDRGNAKQQTDVVQLDSEVLDVAEESGRQIVSVRFHGLIREDKDAPAVPFDEVWHLVRGAEGGQDAQWAIAGIAQTEAA